MEPTVANITTVAPHIGANRIECFWLMSPPLPVDLRWHFRALERKRETGVEPRGSCD